MIDITTKYLWKNVQHIGWTYAKPVSQRSRSLHFKFDTFQQAEPNHSNLRPTTIYKNGKYIISEGTSHIAHSTNTSRIPTSVTPDWLINSKEMFGDEKDIATAIRAGSAIAVSDGSYVEQTGKGTAAAIITNDDTTAAIQVTSIVPGEIGIQGSYRSELTGLLSILQMLC